MIEYEKIKPKDKGKGMTQEDEEKLSQYTQGIAEILYRNTKEKKPEQLKTLEGIEVEVREQILENVSPKIGIFLSRQAQGQKQEKSGI